MQGTVFSHRRNESHVGYCTDEAHLDQAPSSAAARARAGGGGGREFAHEHRFCAEGAFANSAAVLTAVTLPLLNGKVVHVRREASSNSLCTQAGEVDRAGTCGDVSPLTDRLERGGEPPDQGRVPSCRLAQPSLSGTGHFPSKRPLSVDSARCWLGTGLCCLAVQALQWPRCGLAPGWTHDTLTRQGTARLPQPARTLSMLRRERDIQTRGCSGPCPRSFQL